MPTQVAITKHTELTNKEVSGIIDHADSSIPSGKLTFGTWEKIAEVILTSNVTRIDFTGLDINTHKAYLLIYTAKNPTTSTSGINFYVENDTTSANYYKEYVQIDGTTVTAGRVNDPNIVYFPAGDRVAGYVYFFRDPDGYYKAVGYNCYGTGSGVSMCFGVISKTATVTNITQINIVAGVANSIGAGSKFLLFKVSK